MLSDADLPVLRCCMVSTFPRCYPFVCLRRSADCDLLLLLLRRAAEFERIDGATTKLNAKN